MQFKQVVITSAGRQIIARAIAEHKEIIWGKAMTTATNLASYTDDDLRALSELPGGNAGHQGRVTSSVANQDSCTIHCEIENAETSGTVRGLGIYAKLEGEEAEVLSIAGTPGGVSASYIGRRADGVVRIFIDVSIKLADYTATAVTVDASNYAQAGALAVTNKEIETLQRDRVRIYETLLHAAAYAKEGDTFSVKTQDIRQSYSFIPEEEALIQPFTRIIDGIMLVFYFNAEDVNNNVARVMKFDFRRFFKNENPLMDTGLTFNDFADYLEEQIHLIKLKIGTAEELFTVGRTATEQLVVHRLTDQTKHIWDLPLDTEFNAILAFNTAANGIAISVQEGSDMPAIYWIEELDETTLDPIIKTTIRPQDHRNVYAMDIGIAGHQRIIATDSSEAFKTNGKQIAGMMNHFCKVISNANKVWLKSENRILECSEMTSYGEQNAYEVMYMQNYPGDVTQFNIIGIGCNGIIISFIDGTEPNTAIKYSWHGLPDSAEQINGAISCGCYQFEIQQERLGFTIFTQDPTLDYSLCKKIKGDIVPVIHG